MHRMPQIGELGPGVWLASGFGGHGLNTTAMAGNIVARAIVEGDATWRQFTPFELVWAAGAFGRVAAQARVWIKRLGDRIEERRAKARELAHRQARGGEMARAARQAAVEVSAPAQETAVSEADASPTTDLVPLEEPVTSTESIVPALGRAEGPGSPGLLPQQPSAIQPKRKRHRGRGKSSAGGTASQDADEGAKP
jgi:hypothetical protein